MKRRAFIKSMGFGGAAVYIPASLTISSLLQKAYADSPNYEEINYSSRNTAFDAASNAFPQVINIFLYGGPSELAGNLTNLLPGNGDLDVHSQVSYSSQFGDEITRLSNDNGGLISQRGFWIGAGGEAMEFLVSQGHMSVYRTMMQREGGTQSHRDSIFMNQKGTMDLENSPGIGTRIAVALDTVLGDDAIFPQASNPSNLRPLSSLILPFVSFEGENVFYTPDPENSLNLQLKPVTMSDTFANPYTRLPDPDNAQLQSLADTVIQQTRQPSRFKKVYDGFRMRAEMANEITGLRNKFNAALPAAAIMTGDDPLEDITNGVLTYQNNSFARQVRAAVTLAIENPDTKFITISNGGLGGFDDHNNGTDNYPQRMENLFNALRVAMKHIKYSGTQTNLSFLTPGGLSRRTDNIIINVFGDFGRRANLNDSLGWDHGNCQVLYTLGGASVRPGGTNALGKIVGATRRTGTSKSNDQYLVPTDSSYEFEPMSLAASIYRYFGVQNTQVLTSDPVYHPNGHSPINEAVATEPLLYL